MDIDEALSFLRANHRSVLITHNSKGDPAPAPVVHAVDDQGRVVVSTREPSYKVKNLRRDARATLCAINDGFFGPWVTVSGTVEVISLPDAMEPLVEIYRQIAGEHPDWDDYREAMAREKRVVVALTPTTAGPSRQA